MSKYAQILNNKVHWIGEYETVPHFNANVGIFIDITDLTEQPKENWDYIDGNFIDSVVLRKSVYTKAEFIAKIPKSKIRGIQIATETNDDINVWIFNLPMMDKIDLNDLPAWFTEGLSAMITESIFTKNQINSFLEID